MLTHWKTVVIGATAAILAWLLMSLGAMVYVDHQRMNAVWQLELDRAAQQKAGAK